MAQGQRINAHSKRLLAEAKADASARWGPGAMALSIAASGIPQRQKMHRKGKGHLLSATTEIDGYSFDHSDKSTYFIGLMYA